MYAFRQILVERNCFLPLAGAVCLFIAAGRMSSPPTGTAPLPVERYTSADQQPPGLEDATPGLVLDTGTADFGEMFEGTDATRTITVSNSSRKRIEISGVSTPCGCTSVLTKTPVTLEPGASQPLVFRLKTNRVTGALHKRAIVHTSESGVNYEYPIDVRAISRPMIHIDQRRVDLGRLRPGESGTAEILVTLLGPLPGYVTGPPVSIGRTPNRVTASIEEIAPPANARRQWRVGVEVAATHLVDQPLNEDLVIITPSTTEPTARIPVVAAIKTNVAAHPSRVDFGVIRAGGAGVRRIDVTSEAPDGARISSVKVAEAGTGVHIRCSRSETGDVRVSIQPGGETVGPGFHRTEIRLSCELSNGKNETLTIPVTGYRIASSG